MEFLRRLVPIAIRRRYAVKFGIALLILGLSVGLIGYVGTAQITDSVEQNALNDQEALAGQEATALDNWNEQNKRHTSSASNTPVVESGDEEEIQTYLDNLQLELSDQVTAIHYVGVDEHELRATTADAESLEDTDFPAIDGINDDLSASSVERTEAYESDGTPVVSYYIKTSGSDDTALVMTFNLENMMADFGKSVEGERVTMAVDSEGEIVADDRFTGTGSDALIDDYTENVFRQEYTDDDGLLEAAFAEDSANASGAMAFDNRPGATLQNEPYEFAPEGYVAAYHTTDMGWTVLMHTSMDEAYGFVNDVDQYGTMATAGGVLLIGLVGAVLGRNTSVAIDRLTRRAKEMEEGNLEVDLETKRVDNIGRLYDGFDSMRVALREQIEEAEAAREEAEHERERVARLNDHLEEKATEYCDVMGAAADGDLTARADTESENEVMTEIGRDFNHMLEEIEQTVAQLNRFATEVAIASEEVTASSEEVRSASRQVTESVQEISDGADRQNQSLQSVNQEMGGLSTTTEEIAASSNEVADIAERTAETGQEGQDAAHEAITAMNEIETESEQAVSEIRRLEREVQQIDELIATISEIARQTNMLALNANIEASRSASGDDDEGFAVVAKEVKALSEDVAEAADEAEDRLEGIRERTERSAEEVEVTSDQIDDASERVREAVEALEEITDLAQETNVGVQEISAATEEQAASTQEVVAMVDDAASISDQTSAESENVAAAAEEQTTALTEVTESASNLSEQAAELSEGLDRFETDTDEFRAEEPPAEGEESLETETVGDDAVAADSERDVEPIAAAPEPATEPPADPDVTASEGDGQGEPTADATEAAHDAVPAEPYSADESASEPAEYQVDSTAPSGVTDATSASDHATSETEAPSEPENPTDESEPIAGQPVEPVDDRASDDPLAVGPTDADGADGSGADPLETVDGAAVDEDEQPDPFAEVADDLDEDGVDGADGADGADDDDVDGSDEVFTFGDEERE
ncbi:methyl-accepting chemotaxis protein [Natronococcus wangiae]|uniref:methyl-accepting chemotaxis protein n=1 Tax=Natronococcus wangiae TaxID=3068275 RepID=UPI00273FE66F|nr:methyl-accepting chemotaxis protein [Natronococcus sp. AD5]